METRLEVVFWRFYVFEVFRDKVDVASSRSPRDPTSESWRYPTSESWWWYIIYTSKPSRTSVRTVCWHEGRKGGGGSRASVLLGKLLGVAGRERAVVFVRHKQVAASRHRVTVKTPSSQNPKAQIQNPKLRISTLKPNQRPGSQPQCRKTHLRTRNSLPRGRKSQRQGPKLQPQNYKSQPQGPKSQRQVTASRP
jgi:hypothetical protein